MENREEMHIKQMNAEENYMTTPISVLSYITALEEQNKALLDEIERLKTKNRILTDELEDLDKQYSVLNEQFVKTKEWNLEIVYSNKFKDNEIEMLKFQLKASDSVNENLSKQVEWISVEDRLPDYYVKVIIECENDEDNCIDVGAFTRNGWLGHLYKNVKVTHWMPLPNQPK